MKSDLAVSVQNLSKMYLLFKRPEDRLKQSIFGRLGKNYAQVFWAVHNVSFDVHKGEVLGIVGRNGSGKSTLLQVVAGILQPTEGIVQVNGRLTALLELGAGFNPEFTGLENIFLSGSTLGIPEKEMREKVEEILDFAQIGDFIHQPVKLYSSGMFVRLAFAIATTVNPDVLIIDEALAVGDAYFQQKCYRRIQQYKEQGKAILFVTHDAGAVKSLCDRAIWLEEGQLREIGDPEQVVSKYLAFIFGYQNNSPVPSQESNFALPEVENHASAFNNIESVIPNINNRYGDGRAEITGIGLYSEQNERIACASQGQTIQIRISARFKDTVQSPVFGYILRNRNGLDIASTNTDMENCHLPAMQAGLFLTVRFLVEIPVLAPGPYALTIGISDGDYLDYVMCDCIEDISTLEVLAEKVVYAQMRLVTSVIVE